MHAPAQQQPPEEAAQRISPQRSVRSLDDNFFLLFFFGLLDEWALRLLALSPPFLFAIFSGLARGTLRVAEGMNRVIPAWGPETWVSMHGRHLLGSKIGEQQNADSQSSQNGIRIAGPARYCGKMPFVKHAAWKKDRKSTRLNSSHVKRSRMPSSA